MTIAMKEILTVRGLEFVVLAADLSRALAHVQSVVDKRNAIAILSNIKLVVKDNILTLTASDTDLCVTDTLHVQCNAEGSTTLPASTFYEIIRKLDGDMQVAISIPDVNASHALIKVGTSEFMLPTQDVETFPTLEEINPEYQFKIHSETLSTMFGKTKHAISPEDGRYYLNGAFFHANPEGKDIIVVATDGHRLAKAICPIQFDLPKEMPGLLIPRKAVFELVKLLDGFVGDVEINASSNRISFIIGTSTLSSRLIDAKFPDYKRVIPKDQQLHLTVERVALMKSIDLVISVALDRTKAVNLKVYPDKIIVSASTELGGNARGDRDILATSNLTEPIAINFNARYLLDILTVMDCQNVEMLITDSVSGVVMNEDDGVGCLYLLMPLEM